MVGQGGRDESHHHQGRQIRDADVQSGVAFPVSAESESAASERAAAAATAFSARNAGAAATLPEAGAHTVASTSISATDKAYSSPARPGPPARSNSAKSNPNPNPSCPGTARAGSGRCGRRIRATIAPDRRLRCLESDQARPNINRIWWDLSDRGTCKRRARPKDRLGLVP